MAGALGSSGLSSLLFIGTIITGDVTSWAAPGVLQDGGGFPSGAITALTGDVTATGPGSATATLATVNANVGTFGSATTVGQFTVNGKGLITAASSVAITYPGSFSGFGNPTNPGVNLTGSNGSATTAMRSDAVLVLDQTIAPTWTGLHTFTPAANTNAIRISGGSITGSSTTSPGISATGTLNTSGVVLGSAFFANITNTASGTGSSAFEVQLNSIIAFQIKNYAGTQTSGGGLVFQPAGSSAAASFGRADGGAIQANGTTFTVLNTGTNGGNLSLGTTNTNVSQITLGASTFITKPAGLSGLLQLGAADAASPVAQTFRAQGSRAGTDSNVGGANLTIFPGTGTGTGTPSTLILQAPVVVASGSGAQTQTTFLTGSGTDVKIGSGVNFWVGNAATTSLTPGVLAATTNASIVVSDSTGQAYRIPCII